jgi:hypothetical protein
VCFKTDLADAFMKPIIPAVIAIISNSGTGGLIMEEDGGGIVTVAVSVTVVVKATGAVTVSVTV